MGAAPTTFTASRVAHIPWPSPSSLPLEPLNSSPLSTFTPLESILCMVAKVIFLEESSDQTLLFKTLHRISVTATIKFKFSAGRIQAGHLRPWALSLCLHTLGWMPSFHNSIISYTYFFSIQFFCLFWLCLTRD